MDSHLDLEQRRRVREFVRTHHPDVGGDHETFVRGLAALRAGRAVETADVVFYRRRRGINGIVAGVGTMVTRRRRRRRVR